MNKKGFTLIELMVVISIIAILTVIGITIYTSVQKNTRDARRRADIDSIASAMETSYGKTTAGKYNALTSTMFAANQIPLDPINNTDTTACSGNACYYCAREVTLEPEIRTTKCVFPGDALVIEGKPTGSDTFWIVCANLETSNVVYCRRNQQ